jgi:alkyl hydroperoxide reductase subunit AhpC
MSLRLGDPAPNFKAQTTEGEIDFYEYLGNSWGVLFSHPADYTPVCTTELGRTALLKEEFAKRNVKVLAVSVDPLDKHFGWRNDINETQKCNVDFPIIADEKREVATLYDMIHPNASATATVRSLFVIGPDKNVKLMITYPASTGRNFHEVLRVIDSLQLTSKYSLATPANWQAGEDAIVVPAVSTEDAIKKEVDQLIHGKKATWEVGTLHRKSWTGLDITYEPFHPAWKIDLNHELTQACIAAYRENFGSEPAGFDFWDFSTNAVTPVGMGIPTIGFGPGEYKLAHMRNENCKVEQIIDACWFYVRLIDKI